MKTPQLTVQFLGAAGTVTGSKYLLTLPNKKILVDCGLFQGPKELRLRNRQPLPFDAGSLDCVLLTHGHLDHVGYLPLLVKQGFKGPIYGSQPTLEITRLILLDSARIQEEDAGHANEHGYSKHRPAMPLYTVAEAETVFPLLQKCAPNGWVEIDEDVSFRLRYNGHILGACFIELQVFNKLLVFSGDIGRLEDPLLFPPEKPEHADILFIESTYGNRRHERDPEYLLAKAIRSAVRKDGTIVIPSFAVERTQLLMYYVWKLRQDRLIPPIPVYMDSPMGANVLDVFWRNQSWHKLSPGTCAEICQDIRLVRKREETLHLAADRKAKIIIAASGMASGGRVLTYFEHFLKDPKSTVLLVGHQGEGTRGRALLDGAKEIRMYGKYWPVKAQVMLVGGLSAHADQAELINWVDRLDARPEKIFIVHGETDGAEALRETIVERYAWNCAIPAIGDTYTTPLIQKRTVSGSAVE